MTDKYSDTDKVMKQFYKGATLMHYVCSYGESKILKVRSYICSNY